MSQCNYHEKQAVICHMVICQKKKTSQSMSTVTVQLVTKDGQLVVEKQVPLNANGQINLADLGREWKAQNFVWVDAEQPLNELRDGWSDVSFSFAAGSNKSPVILSANGIGMHGLRSPLKPASTSASSTVRSAPSAPVSGPARPAFVTSMGALSSLVKKAKAREQDVVSDSASQPEQRDNKTAITKSSDDGNGLDGLEIMHDLWKKGILTDAEFQEKKRQILGL